MSNVGQIKYVIWEGMPGWTTRSEYGDPLITEDFDFVHPLSPVHNIPMSEKSKKTYKDLYVPI